MAELLCRAGDPEWGELRRSGVTATDIVTIAGLSSWDSPWSLFWRKKGVLPEVEQTDRMRLGTWLEQSIAGHWAVRHGYNEPALAGGLMRSSERSWQMATPDLVSPADEPLECKSWSTFDGWGPDGSGEVPPAIRAQLIWQMDTLGVARGHVAVVFLPSGEFRSYTIEHPADHEPYLAMPDETSPCRVCWDMACYRERGLEFYRRLTGELPPPDVDGHAATTAGLKTRYASPSTSGEFRSYTIEHDRKGAEHCDAAGVDRCRVCEETEDLRIAGLEFYRRLTGELPPPDVDGHAATTAGLKTRYASPGANLRAELPPALMEAWEEARDELAAARAGLKEYERAAREAENTIRAALADAAVGTVDGRPVIERKFTKRAGYTVAPTELDQLKPIKGNEA